ncbi:MAG: SPOR domain-containing protein [Ignavibacteriaceae bacterium]|nr:SPOR domain-containing protein [Ignavibacteriaceae bacterium]
MRTIFTISVLILLALNVFPQGIEITDYLKKIESGKIDEVKEKLPELKSKYPDDPSVLFLDGILTENGKVSLKLYSTVVNSYPDSKYADAAAYRIYSYYYATDQFDDAATWLNRLKKDYPTSPYIKIAEKNVPPVEQKKINRINKENEQKLKAKYTIQAGAFSSKENAETLKNQFINAGYSSEIKEKEVAGTLFNIVCVGKFNTMEEAKKFLQQINSEYSLDGRVVNNN